MDIAKKYKVAPIPIHFLLLELRMIRCSDLISYDPIISLVNYVTSMYPFVVIKCIINSCPIETKTDLLLEVTLQNPKFSMSKTFDVQSSSLLTRTNAIMNAKQFIDKIAFKKYYCSASAIEICINDDIKLTVNDITQSLNDLSQSLNDLTNTSIPTYCSIELVQETIFKPTIEYNNSIYHNQKLLLELLKPEDQPWFFNGDRTDTEKRLSECENYTFCIRPSSMAGAYALTYNRDREYMSCLINKRISGFFSGERDYTDNSVITGIFTSSIFYFVAYWKLYGLDANEIMWHPLNEKLMITDNVPSRKNSIGDTLNASGLLYYVSLTRQFMSAKFSELCESSINKDLDTGPLLIVINMETNSFVLKSELYDTLELDEIITLNNRIINYFYDNNYENFDIHILQLPTLHISFKWYLPKQ